MQFSFPYQSTNSTKDSFNPLFYDPIHQMLISYPISSMETLTCHIRETIQQIRSVSHLQQDFIMDHFNPKIEFSDTTQQKQEPSYLKNETIPIKAENSNKDNLSFLIDKNSPEAFDRNLRSEIYKMVTFILLQMGQNDKTYIEVFRKSYLHNSHLLHIYDKLVMKYFSAKKCKEDINRYIIRKAFKVFRTSIIKKEKVSTQKASVLLCKRYFQKNFEELKQSQINIENEDEILEFFMPYNKKSKNKTMNSTFLTELFSSEEFCKDYQELFLPEFINILIKENNNKKEKLINFIIECIKNDSISYIGSFSRFPWLDSWVEETKNLAMSLPEKSGNSYPNLKKPKHY